MKLVIQIELDNAAFQDGNAGSEVARILTIYTSKISEAPVPELLERPNLWDVNGNNVGSAIVQEY